MVLSSSTKEKIMDVRDYYEKREQMVDMDFINNILTIVRSEEAFKEELAYKFVEERKWGPACVIDGTAYFNMDLFIKYVKSKTKYGFSGYSKEDMIKYYNFTALLVVLHECSHIWQCNGLEEYSEINRLHRDVQYIRTFYLKDIMKAIKFKISTLRINNHDYTERQANIDAFRELVEMYQGYEFLDFVELQHIYNLSFKPKGESIVHDTLNKLSLEYNYICDGIPQDLLFEVGLPTDKSYSEAVYDAIDKYSNDELSYGKVIEKIKKY